MDSLDSTRVKPDLSHSLFKSKKLVMRRNLWNYRVLLFYLETQVLAELLKHLFQDLKLHLVDSSKNLDCDSLYTGSISLRTGNPYLVMIQPVSLY